MNIQFNFNDIFSVMKLIVIMYSIEFSAILHVFNNIFDITV